MSKFIITSPVFGEFRAGEPAAYRLASKVISNKGNTDFRLFVDGDEVKYDSEERIITVNLKKYGEFEFHVSEIDD